MKTWMVGSFTNFDLPITIYHHLIAFDTYIQKWFIDYDNLGQKNVSSKYGERLKRSPLALKL